LASDITCEGLYGEEWLIVTIKRFLVFSVDRLDMNNSSEIELDSIKRIDKVLL